MQINCRRRACPNPATVATRTAGGAIDEHLCERHALEIVKARVEALNQARYMGTKRPFVIVTMVRVEGGE